MIHDVCSMNYAMSRVAINGFGRIGRAFFRQAFGRDDIEIVAINDLGDLENLAYLLKYDSVYRRYDLPVGTETVGDKRSLVVDGKNIAVVSEKEPTSLPWKDLKVDVVVESTGFFTDAEGAGKHITAGAKRVVITAPGKDGATQLLVGTDDARFAEYDLDAVTCNASCTTNAAAPAIAVLHEALGIEKGIVQTVHSYTSTQSLVDGPGKKDDFLRGRAAAANIVPSSTGAAEAVAKSIPALEGKFTGIAIRVPTIAGSLAMFTGVVSKKTSVEAVNDLYRKASAEPRWKGILGVSEDALVSSDIIGRPEPALIDLPSTKVVGGDLVTVYSWYDNEWGYTHSLVEHVARVAKRL